MEYFLRAKRGSRSHYLRPFLLAAALVLEFEVVLEMVSLCRSVRPRHVPILTTRQRFT